MNRVAPADAFAFFAPASDLEFGGEIALDVVAAPVSGQASQGGSEREERDPNRGTETAEERGALIVPRSQSKGGRRGKATSSRQRERHHPKLASTFAADANSLAASFLPLSDFQMAGVPASSRDQLGHLPYAVELARFLTHAGLTPPFTCGVYGEWGQGKSAFLQLLQECIEDEVADAAQVAAKAAKDRRRKRRQNLCRFCCCCCCRCCRPEDSNAAGPATGGIIGVSDAVFIRFNAWLFAGSNCLWSALVRQLFESVEQRYGVSFRIFRWRSRHPGIARALLVALLLLLAAVLLVVFYWSFVISLVSRWEWLLLVALPPLIGALGLVRAHMVSLAAALRLDDASADVFVERMGFMANVRDELELLAQFVAEPRWVCGFPSLLTSVHSVRFFVLVDDLDRVEAAKAVQVLKALSLLFQPVRAPGRNGDHVANPFVAVVAVDPRLLIPAIESTLHTGTERGANADALHGSSAAPISGYSYLDKIVQLPFTLPFDGAASAAIHGKKGSQRDDGAGPAVADSYHLSFLDRTLVLTNLLLQLLETNNRAWEKWIRWNKCKTGGAQLHPADDPNRIRCLQHVLDLMTRLYQDVGWLVDEQVVAAWDQFFCPMPKPGPMAKPVILQISPWLVHHVESDGEVGPLSRTTAVKEKQDQWINVYKGASARLVTPSAPSAAGPVTAHAAAAPATVDAVAASGAAAGADAPSAQQPSLMAHDVSELMQLSPYLDRNPRRFKRVLNVYALARRVWLSMSVHRSRARIRGLKEQQLQQQLAALLRLLFMCEMWPLRMEWLLHVIEVQSVGDQESLSALYARPAEQLTFKRICDQRSQSERDLLLGLDAPSSDLDKVLALSLPRTNGSPTLTVGLVRTLQHVLLNRNPAVRHKVHVLYAGRDQ